MENPNRKSKNNVHCGHSIRIIFLREFIYIYKASDIFECDK